jgi:hypothetical protein
MHRKMKSLTVRKWIKELVGLPTYLSVIFIGMVVIDGGFLVTLLCVILAAAAYNAIYERLFPGYVIQGKMGKTFVLAFLQLLVWGVALLLLSWIM